MFILQKTTKNHIFIDRKIAFTLAEVLIVIGIIGMIANMTIPTLMNKINNQQYVERYKKAYTEWNQVIAQLTNDMGCTGNLKCTGLFDASKTNQTLGDAFVPYFNVIKNCGTSTVLGCMPNNMSTNYDGSAARIDQNQYGDYEFITADGMAFSLRNGKNSCTSNASAHVTENLSSICAALYMDINGPQKGPNNLGRDVYNFNITNGHGAIIYPGGGIDTSGGGWRSVAGTILHCAKTPSETGDRNSWYCAGRILEEGWQMNY